MADGSGGKLQARSAGSGWDASACVRPRRDWHGHQWSWDGGLWVRLLFVFDGRVPQGVVGKRVQERRAANAKTDAGHTDSKRVCGHRGSAWPPLPDVVQYCEGSTVWSVRPVCVSGVGAREHVQQVVTIPWYWTASFVIYSTVGAAGRAFLTLCRFGLLPWVR